MKKIIALLLLCLPCLVSAEQGFIFGPSSTTVVGLFSDKKSLTINYTGDLSSQMSFGFQKCDTLVSTDSVSGVFYSTDTTGLNIISYTEFGSTTGLTALSFDDLYCTSNMSITGLAEITSLSFPVLKAQTQASTNLVINNMPSLTTLYFPELEYSGAHSFARIGSPALSFPKLKYMAGNMSFFSMNNLTTISYPVLEYILGSIGITNLPLANSLSVPNLKTVGGNITIPATVPLFSSLSFPSLTNIDGSLTLTGPSDMNNLSMPNLISIGGQVLQGFAAGDATIQTQPNVSTVSFPSLTTLYGNFTIAGSSNVTQVSLPAIVNCSSITANTTNGSITSFTFGAVGVTMSAKNINVGSQKLDQTSVDQILHTIASLDGTGGTTSWGTGRTLTLNGGTNSTPSAAGLADKAIIVGRGATVLNN